MADLMIRRIPIKTREDFKAHCAQGRVSMRARVIELIQEDVREAKEVREKR